MEQNNKHIDEALGLVDKEYKKKNLSKLFNNLLHLFLPHDIDMQALILAEEGKANYLEQMYNDNIDYYQKVNKLQSKIRELDEIEWINKERLNDLVNDASSFFEKLKGKEKNLREVLEHNWQSDKVNSFHDWYCALNSCLRGKDACK